jgi:hypothetical protein
LRNTVSNKKKLIKTIKLKIELSFRTTFTIHYINELFEEKYVDCVGDFYSREFYYEEKQFNFFCMLFVYNKDYNDNEYALIIIEYNNNPIDRKKYHILNTKPYDGWFFYEKTIECNITN